ncbi:MAG: hypothetical protein HY738_10130, partial [Bacteroidia bacterium]|nr:hypothetical protein [Bacteroidia bacterium]
WSTGAVTQDISGRPAGTYTVTITDANGCTTTASATITQPASAVSVTTTQTNVACFGNSTGSATANPAGGTPGYSYLWTGGFITQTISNRPAGTYTVTVTDANGCTATATVTITQPVSGLTLTTSQTNVACFGNSTGSATVNPAGGTPAYSYSWSTSATTQAISNQPAGTYTVTVADASGYTASASVTITQPAAPLSAITNVTNLACFGEKNGAIDLVPSGGTPAYSYAWSNGATTQDISGLFAGTYTVTITDANNCTTTATATVSQPASALSLTTTQTNVACFGQATGSATANPAGGTPGYSYLWTGGLITQTINNLTAGTYWVTVTDNNSCSIVASVIITQPAGGLSASISSSNVSCNGGANGSADLTVSGGTPAYSYLWSSSQTNQDIINIPAGTYTVTVTDANSCTITSAATITQPVVLSLTMSGADPLCNGTCNGTATATPSGGSIPYTYNWDGNTGFQITQTANNLCDGTYSVTVTDVNGCVITGAQTINEPAAIVLTTSSVNSTCSASDGSATVNVAGGTPNYDYEWSNGSNTYDTTFLSNTITNVSAGAYTVTVTDDNSCSATAVVNVVDAAAPTANISSSTNVSCNGLSNGSATVTVAGGASPYDYIWSNGSTTWNSPLLTNTISGLIAGAYSVTVNDNNNCIASASVTITQPPVLNASITSVTNVGCNGASTGSATVTAGGGTPIYFYDWSPDGYTGDGTVTYSGLPAGPYTVTVTDSQGCTDDASANITQPAVLNASIVGSDVLCNGGSSGSADLTVTGGTLPYTYLWSNSSVNQNITNLTAGLYSVTVTDVNSCTATASVTINEPLALIATISGTNVNCFGETTGTADLTINGGTPAYSILWNTGATTEPLSGLASGVYSVTVTDINSCTTTASITITQPAAALTATISGTNVLCNGGNNGAADLTVSGGTVVYTYSWSNFAITEDITGLTANTYVVTVTDANSCTVTASVNITEPTVLTANITGTDVNCNGGNDGTADLSVSGGVSPYTYQWSTGSFNQDITNLTAGTYGVTITDDNGCITTASVIINEPAAALSASIFGTDVTAAGADDGSANLTVLDGTIPYLYIWSNGETTEDLDSLSGGTYTVTVTDFNGCTVTATVVINEPGVLIASIAGTNIDCNGDSTGAANLTVSGGVIPYTYLWSNGETTEDISDLPADIYTVTVTDDNLITITATVTIAQPSALTATIAGTDVNCFGGNDGSATANPSGGTPGYTYLWSSGPLTQTITNLTAGTYSVTVTDFNNCTVSATGSINQPAAALSATTTITNILCFGEKTGAIDLIPSGGTSPYSYSWSNGDITEDISGLFAGTYTVTITDANNCTAIISATVTEPASVLSVSTSQTNVNCNGGNDGSATATPSGGTLPYSYSWTGGFTTQTINSLTAGTYSCTVTDSNGCIIIASVTITQPASALSATISQVNVSCFGGNDGSATVNTSGGTASYIYSWMPGGYITQNINGLTAGIYNLTVTDANLCTTTASATITEPSNPLSASIIGADVTAAGADDGSADLTVSGGTIPYSFIWSNGETTEDLDSLSGGSYTVTVTDFNGCTVTATVTINEPGVIIAFITGTNINCNGDSTGVADLTVSGGVIPYTYLWSNGAATEDISNLPAGVYTVTVTDANLISVIASVTITESALLTASVAVNDVNCFGGNDGSADLSVAGGTPAYAYLWSDTSTDQDLSSLTAGIYDVTITDANLCTTTASVTVSEPSDSLSASIIGTDVTAAGADDGSADLTVLGGTIPYSFIWSNGETTEDLDSLSGGTYTVTVTDFNGCTVTATVVINEPGVLTAFITGTNIDCNGDSTGAADLTVSGGVIPYTYLWSNGATTEDISGLPAGVYTVTVTDANSISVTASVTITEPALLTASVAVNDVNCFGGNDGSADLSVAGGTPAYTYFWSDASTDQNLYNLTAGIYDVTITDANLCTTTASVTITEPSDSLSASIIGADVTAAGAGDGSAGLTVSGGTIPYSFMWSNGDTIEDLDSLSGGIYTVTVTDFNGCTVIATVVINEPGVIIAFIAGTNVDCNGDSTGAADLTVSGGVRFGYYYRTCFINRFGCSKRCKLFRR